MKRAFIGFLLLLPVSAFSQRFTAENGRFQLDKEPFRILSGEMHYSRIPEEYWRDRLLKAKAMGLNSICTYVFWNIHEPTPGVFTFDGNLNIAKFIRQAQELGLYVLVRPGPYVCSEWDFGGLPAWLLKDPELKIRCMYPGYWNSAKRYVLRLGKELGGLTIDKGGPIIAVQVENEYGSYGNDKEYLRALVQTLREAGFDCLLFTSDGSNPMMLEAGTLPNVLPAVNFDSNPVVEFANLEKFRKNIPHLNGEFWSGWFTQWGQEKWGGQNLEKQREDVRWMLENGKSFNFYMFHGGTNFGFTAGANIYDNRYWPDITSYDYGAPLTEDGEPTGAFSVYRELLRQFGSKGTAPPDPTPVKRIAIPSIAITRRASLFEHLPQPIASAQPLPMERLGQNFGYILYRTKITGLGGKLRIKELHDYAMIYVDGAFIGTMDRRFGQDTLTIPGHAAKERVLDIFVEALGRVNFSANMIDRKGITEYVALNWLTLMNWEIYTLPLEYTTLQSMRFSGEKRMYGPGVFKGTFDLAETGDTFLDMRQWSKGVVWVNGRNLGRYWKTAGPQYDLYLPGVWLKKGKNEILIMDLDVDRPAPLRGDALRRAGR